MAKHAKFVVALHPEDARLILQEVLTAARYRYSWEHQQRGLAEKGSKTKAALLGVFSMYYPYSLQIDLNGDDTVTVSLFQASTGMMGGAIGITKVRKELDALVTATRLAYEAKGVLRHLDIG
ncbi:hypothetical protein [Nocardiopsis ansamitocini]|uniref:Uncharacterized protein n=1 Tax=Nocardiopsis ansamitocini TaxID=1670832 RepID=A0A9W6P378_9ACTN|nr:hypothetical protein [Nocardiopsis ansamitocini]GLU46331.1 hypothetical protein Nans01_06820 [Nocardiopsis ansamitocini]